MGDEPRDSFNRLLARALALILVVTVGAACVAVVIRLFRWAFE